jgi:DNA-binding response OmpR family regulator
MKKKVLVIENDRDIRDIVSFILEEAGFKCLGMPEPEKIEHLRQFDPDIILLDEFINNKPGHRLCLRIKHDETLQHLPVIILSTANNIELIAKECKANDFVRKPFDVDDLVTKVISVIENQQLTSSY